MCPFGTEYWIFPRRCAIIKQQTDTNNAEQPKRRCGFCRGRRAEGGVGMKQPATVLKKLLLGAVLITLSACLTMLIKESLDTQDPEAALPILTVTCGDVPINDVYRAGYAWSFFATVERRTPQLLEEDLPLVPVDVNPQTEVRLNFSSPPSELQVQRAQGLGSGEYLQMVSDNPSVFRAPSAPGVYVYKVIATWSRRGYIQYYFALQVRDMPSAAAAAG